MRMVIIFLFFGILPFIFRFFYLFIVHSFCVPFQFLIGTLIRVYILLTVILIVVVKPVTIECFKENSLQNIPNKENNNRGKYQLKNVLHNKFNFDLKFRESGFWLLVYCCWFIVDSCWFLD